MKSFVSVFFLGVAIPSAVADDKDDAAKKLNGSYQVLSVIVDGKPNDKMKDLIKEYTIKDGRITIKEGRFAAETESFTVDPAQKPPHIDFLTGGGVTVKGIYEAKATDKGLELTIAWVKNPKAPRPKDFKCQLQDETVHKLFRKK
jgi:uncharacterized protein (TIGR03067 family)